MKRIFALFILVLYSLSVWSFEDLPLTDSHMYNDIQMDSLITRTNILSDSVEVLSTHKRVYAYSDTLVATTCVSADSFYFLKSSFDNKVLDGFSLNGGIELTISDDVFFVCVNYSGASNKTARIYIGLFKNATYDGVSGKLLTGYLLEGGVHSTQAYDGGLSSGFVGITTTAIDLIEQGDLISIAIKSDTNNTTITPDNINASIFTIK